MTTFDQCFQATLGHEGTELDKNPTDPGNWTGGAVGRGELRGSRCGISARAYPTEDIANMTPDRAHELYRRDYWSVIHGDELPAPLALLAFDAAVNAGPARSVDFLQAAAGSPVDGRMGPVTLRAIEQRLHAEGGAALCIEALAQRMYFQAALPTWRSFGLGWSRRLAALPYQSVLLVPRSSP